MKIKWKIYCGSKHIDSGTIQAESERDAMGQVLLAQDGKLKAEESYSFTVGDMKMSTYGDECRRSAEVSGYGRDAEQEPLKGGHHFPAPDKELMERLGKKLAEDVITTALDKLTSSTQQTAHAIDEFNTVLPSICQKWLSGQHDMNDMVVNPTTGENHAKCYHCGFIDPHGLGTYDRGGWPGTFTAKQVDTISTIARLYGHDPDSITDAVQSHVGHSWQFGLTDGTWFMISDLMIAQFSG